MDPSQQNVEWLTDHHGRAYVDAADAADAKTPERRGRIVGPALVLVMFLIVIWLSASGDESGSPAPAETLPALLVAEGFAASPSRDGLQDLFEAIGGFDGLELGVAEGAFDVVRFDPINPDRLFASHRLSYGDAENQTVNELWNVTQAGEVEQSLWAPQLPHDFVHFNVDGTATMWVHGGGPGFAPREAVVLDSELEPIFTTPAMYASRFTATANAVFALTGNGDYYSNESAYSELIADVGDGPVVLDEGQLYAWIDNPTADVLVAYPADEGGETAVWDVATLEPLTAHPFAGRNYQRVAVSGDRQVVVAVTSDGAMEILDPASGVVLGRFGELDVGAIDRPISLNSDGSVAVTVEGSGRVRIWWVGDGDPIATFMADAAQPRWVSERYATKSASVVSPDATRLALRIPARADQPTRWTIIDTDVSSWLQRVLEGDSSS